MEPEARRRIAWVRLLFVLLLAGALGAAGLWWGERLPSPPEEPERAQLV